MEECKILGAGITDVADGMLYLSNSGFVHRDLAARNVFVSKGKAKIGDFGQPSLQLLRVQPVYGMAGVCGCVF